MSAISSQLAQAVTPPIAPSPKSVSRTTFVGERRSVQVPGWVRDLASFRRWVHSGEYPEKVRICYLAGEIWVDLSMETDFHNQIKTVITIVVGSIVLNEALGRFYAIGNHGYLIVRETRLAYELLREDTARLLEALRSPPSSTPQPFPPERRLD